MTFGRTRWQRGSPSLGLLLLLPLFAPLYMPRSQRSATAAPAPSRPSTSPRSSPRSLRRSPPAAPRPSASSSPSRSTGTSTGSTPATPASRPPSSGRFPKASPPAPCSSLPQQRLPLGPLMDFGYEDQVAFPITLTAPAERQTRQSPPRRPRNLARLRAGLPPRQGPPRLST